ncbi:MAG: SdrD B-like domain-containing protein [Aureliella sp.]
MLRKRSFGRRLVERLEARILFASHRLADSAPAAGEGEFDSPPEASPVPAYIGDVAPGRSLRDRLRRSRSSEVSVSETLQTANGQAPRSEQAQPSAEFPIRAEAEGDPATKAADKLPRPLSGYAWRHRAWESNEFLATADFDRDGWFDVLTQNRDSGDLLLTRSSPVGRVSDVWGTWDPAVEWAELFVRDFDGDGLADILTLDQSGRWWLSKNTGAGFETLPWGQSAGHVETRFVDGDFNDDRVGDVAYRASSGTWYVGFGSPTGLASFENWGQSDLTLPRPKDSSSSASGQELDESTLHSAQEDSKASRSHVDESESPPIQTLDGLVPAGESAKAPTAIIPENQASLSSSDGPGGIFTQGILQMLIDLDGDDSTASGNDFANAFTEENGYVRILDTDFVFDDLAEEDTVELLVRPTGGVPDGSDEFLIFRRDGGVSSVKLDGSEPGPFNNSVTDGFAFEYEFDTNEQAVAFRPASGGVFPTSSLRLLMDGLRYYNTDDDPDTTDRTFEVFSRDNSAVTSTIGTATITVSPVNDAPSLDLDRDDSTNADPVILGRESATFTFDTATTASAALFNGDTADVTSSAVFSSGFTATAPAFVAKYFERGRLVRVNASTSSSVAFSGGVAPDGTLLLLHDVDRNEEVQITSTSGTPTLIEGIETISGETTAFPVWDPNTGNLTGDTANGVGGATIFDVSGFSDLTLVTTSQGSAEFGFITPRQNPINFLTGYTEGGSAVSVVDTDVDVDDVDDTNSQRVTITLTNGQPGDQLSLNESTLTGLGLTLSGDFNTPLAAAGTIDVVLEGPISQSDMESALRGIQFESVSVDPDTRDRLIDFVAEDASSAALTAQSVVRVSAVDPDLRISKSDGGISTEVGATIPYTLTVENVGSVATTGVFVTENLPAGTTFNASASTSGWTDQGVGVFQFLIGDLAAGATTDVLFAADYTDGQVTVISNTASVADDGSLGSDLNPSDNTTSDGTPVVASDSSIAGVVFQDSNVNGQFDGEPAISGVLVALSGTTSLGNPIDRTATTDANGEFRFDTLPPGIYSVTETQPDGFRDGADSTDAANSTVLGDDSLSIEVGLSESVNVRFAELTSPNLAIQKSDGGVTADFSGVLQYTLTVSNIGDQDANGVEVTEVLPTGTEFEQSQSTVGWVDAGNGVFRFDVGTLAARDSVDLQFAVTITDDQLTQIANTASVTDDNAFGNDLDESDNSANTSTSVNPSTGRISGFVYDDTNSNGAFDPSDNPIEGVTVNLAGSSTNGTPITRTLTTDAAGAYVFENLPAGTYTVTETQPANFNDGADTTTSPNGSVVGDDALQITLAEGEAQAVNFGEESTATTPGNGGTSNPNSGGTNNPVATTSLTKRSLLSRS